MDIIIHRMELYYLVYLQCLKNLRNEFLTL